MQQDKGTTPYKWQNAIILLFPFWLPIVWIPFAYLIKFLDITNGFFAYFFLITVFVIPLLACIARAFFIFISFIKYENNLFITLLILFGMLCYAVYATLTITFLGWASLSISGLPF